MSGVAQIFSGAAWARFSTDVTFTHPVTGKATALRGIDKSAGVAVFDQSLRMETMRPAAWLRKSDLDALAITNADMEGVQIVMNGVSWRIRSVSSRPNIDGEAAGLVQCILGAE